MTFQTFSQRIFGDVPKFHNSGSGSKSHDVAIRVDFQSAFRENLKYY